MPNRSATTARSTVPSAAAPAGIGTHMSPLHAPSGLRAQPVWRSKSFVEAWSRSVIMARPQPKGSAAPLGDPAEDVELGPAFGIEFGEDGLAGRLALIGE